MIRMQKIREHFNISLSGYDFDSFRSYNLKDSHLMLMYSGGIIVLFQLFTLIFSFPFEVYSVRIFENRMLSFSFVFLTVYFMLFLSKNIPKSQIVPTKKELDVYYIGLHIYVALLYLWAILVTCACVDAFQPVDMFIYAVTVLTSVIVLPFNPVTVSVYTVSSALVLNLLLFYMRNKLDMYIIYQSFMLCVLAVLVDFLTFRVKLNRFRAEQALSTQITYITDLNSKLREDAYLDGLTHLYNRHYLTDNIDVPVYDESQDSFVGVIMFDIDHFKRVNDTYGHPVGDLCLVSISNTLKQFLSDYRNTENSSVVYAVRYGGEEFLIQYSAATPEFLFEQAERLRKLIEDLEIPLVTPDKVDEAVVISDDTNILKCTISLGCACANKANENLTQLINIADKNLYYSKEHGRNQVTI